MTAGWVKRKLHLHYSFTSVFFFKKKSSKQTKHPNVTLCDLHNGVWHMKKWKKKIILIKRLPGSHHRDLTLSKC